MIWLLIFSALAAVPPVFMMRRELLTGYSRWRDYLLVLPLLLGLILLFYALASLEMPGTGWLSGISLLLRAFLMFWAMSFTWGAGLITGALILKVVGAASRTHSRQ